MSDKTFSRRTALQGGASLIAAPAILRVIPAHAQSRTIKIGHVSPRTGPLAAFGEADPFILEQINKLLANGIQNGGKTYKVEIISKDSQSNTARASEVASELILRDKVDLIVAASTPDTTNPVADQAEVNEVPCITTDCPWQAYFFGRKGDPRKGFNWTYHFFWGAEDLLAAFTALWDQMPTNKVVGGMFSNDADGNAFADPVMGFPPALAKAGYKLVNPGLYQPLSNDFTAQISAFKAANVEIVTGVFIPPDFATFWSQAAQQGFKPKIVTVAKALLFPSAVAALGDRGEGLTSEIWWTPTHPFKSGLTGQTPKQLTDAYTAATTRPWTQPIGFKHALFEVAIDVLKRTKKLDDPASIRDAIAATNYQSIVGPVQWSGQPVKNVTKTPLVAGQWQKKDGKLDLVVTTNKPAPQIPVGGTLKALT
ncbi:MAG: ABC transporter substrate-binding protein [Pseudolabrys sp.]|nr:ABC transporter substrate-binding protein [Pseudolabrys sp.]